MNTKFYKVLFLLLVFIHLSVFSAPPMGVPVPPAPGLPIDMGIGLLVAGAVGLGIRTLNKVKR